MMATLESKELLGCLERSLGKQGAEAALEAFRGEASVSVRLNPYKQPADGELFPGAVRIPWSEHGRMLSERPSFTLMPEFHAGAFYVQDSSAMFVGHVFRRLLDRFSGRDGLRVLDLCAAPGGKTTDLAASLRAVFGDNFTLVANEVMRQRASVLSDNVALWGDPAVIVTSVDPKAFARFESFFDIIVADVPCSGEGMFRKDPRALEEWSGKTVELCAARQRRILADVWPALKEGGALLYSTCTFEPSENDGNLLWAAEELGGEILPPDGEFGLRTTSCGHLLVPGEVPGEGQWAGVMIRTAPGRTDRKLRVQDLSVLRPLRMGTSPGEMKGNDFVPDPDSPLSISFDHTAFPSADVDRATALAFLHRDAISLPDSPKGYIVITYRGLPLGFVKNVGTRCNNLLPQSRRIRMDIRI